MASHKVTVAKAAFTAGLLPPAHTSLSRDQIAQFHTLLDVAVEQGLPQNIQSCKAWLLVNVVDSSARVGVLGKYLVALSRSFDGDGVLREKGSTGKKPMSAKRKRLHLLYVLHDVLHHTKYHGPDSTAFSTLSSCSQPHLVELIRLAASSDDKRITQRLDDLLQVWEEDNFYSTDYVGKLRETVANAAEEQPSSGQHDDSSALGSTVGARDRPFLMPATHGDPSTPYYDLPAGNMMPHIVPNSSTPIKPDQVKPLRFLAGPADESLVNAVKDFLKDMEKIYEPGSSEQDEGIVTDIDELGQMVLRDEITGEVNGGDAYYGWSRAFCEKMKRRRNGEPEHKTRARSRSSSRSRSPRKRRRYSDSMSSRSRSYSPSRSRSRSRPVLRGRNGDEGGAYLSRSRSRSRPNAQRYSRSPSYSPQPPPTTRLPLAPPPPPASNSTTQFSPTPPLVPYGIPMGNFPPPPIPPGRGVPIPPPRPPNWQGPWPPPPPPPSSMPMNASYNGQPGIPFQAPLPPFPPNFQQGGQFTPPSQNGRGGWAPAGDANQRGGYYGARGRGGWQR